LAGNTKTCTLLYSSWQTTLKLAIKESESYIGMITLLYIFKYVSKGYRMSKLSLDDARRIAINCASKYNTSLLNIGYFGHGLTFKLIKDIF